MTTATRHRNHLPLVAAIAYALAWVAGLSVNSSSTRVRDSGRQVIETLRGHHTTAGVQYVLTEGVTTVLLVLTLWPVWQAIRRPGPRAVLLAATATAAVVAFVEMGLGLRLVGGEPGAATAGTLNDALNRLDGAKMLLLAVAFGGAAAAIRRRHLDAPRWFGVIGGVTAITLVVSGIGYATLNTPLAAAAWFSLPALIVAVVSAGVVISRSAGRRSGSA